ncbi:hypothetical protein [Chryseobacterium sp. Hurlbut01]|jgi:hypothetical protein|uniref:hypothetical protein n=1 Tax=Chryseobacterium sp. Hurlbut01 TaxID=1681828 RepID=UPI00067D3373|nr:hypothetical protein [Chryseobacterium sp. Hurlbut01]KNB61329.1 hypothetical protein AC804_08070 [Chryseobacterium sp. Hurlbut01]
MIQKYFSITIILLGILVVSCRQDNEVNNQNEENSFLQKKTIKDDLLQNPESTDNDNISQKSDSTYVGVTPNDPPKNGTHYRLTDSLGVYIDTTNPPKNGTHYKSK